VFFPDSEYLTLALVLNDEFSSAEMTCIVKILSAQKEVRKWFGRQ
jgi:hypothetical protein